MYGHISPHIMKSDHDIPRNLVHRSVDQENWILGVLVLLFILLGSLTVMTLGSNVRETWSRGVVG